MFKDTAPPRAPFPCHSTNIQPELETAPGRSVPTSLPEASPLLPGSAARSALKYCQNQWRSATRSVRKSLPTQGSAGCSALKLLTGLIHERRRSATRSPLKSLPTLMIVKSVSTPGGTLNAANFQSVAATPTAVAAVEAACIIAARARAVAEAGNGRCLSRRRIALKKKYLPLALAWPLALFRAARLSGRSQKHVCRSFRLWARSTRLRKVAASAVGRDQRLECVAAELTW